MLRDKNVRKITKMRKNELKRESENSKIEQTKGEKVVFTHFTSRLKRNMIVFREKLNYYFKSGYKTINNIGNK